MLNGIRKIEAESYIIYYIENFTDEIKQEIRNHLVSICHGSSFKDSELYAFSYEETVKEFIKRCNKNSTEGDSNRKKGMIGELLIHLMLENGKRFDAVSAFFNSEERSFKKGFDICLYEPSSNELWITEVKSGEMQQNQKTETETAVSLLNKAKNDLKKRLNDSDCSLWLNAIKGAKQVMNDSDQKRAVTTIMDNYYRMADDETSGLDKNVILAAVVFAPFNNFVKEDIVKDKYKAVVNEKLFGKVLFMVIQEEVYSDVFDFLENEARK